MPKATVNKGGNFFAAKEKVGFAWDVLII